MNTEQYVDSVKQMMNQQNIFVSIFIGILGIVLVFAGVIQWRFSTKQIEEIKRRAKEETVEEILKELSSNSFPEYNDDVKKNFLSQEAKINQFRLEMKNYQVSMLEYEVDKICSRELFLGRLLRLLDVYQKFLIQNPETFDWLTDKYESIIMIRFFDQKLDINDKSIDRIIERLYAIDSEIGTKSMKVRNFSKKISQFRQNE